jgi:monofunctional biosynthetic peptidoglycan transglycosylase
VALVGLLSVVATLPWRWIAPPTTAFIARERMDRAGAGDSKVYYRWRSWEEISPHLAIAVVAAEDQKFPSHHGFDFESISKAIRDRFSRPRGASTISQQVAKNLFLWRERSLLRKGLEAYLTVLIESLWPKRRVLEVYLNVAEFGPGIFGAGAASELLLGKPATQLTLDDAALLAAVLPSPRRMSPRHPSQYVRKRAVEIEEAVRSLGGARYLAGL